MRQRVGLGWPPSGHDVEEAVTQSRQDHDYVLGTLVESTHEPFEAIDAPSDRRHSLGS